MPANLTTLARLSVSAAMNLPKSGDLPQPLAGSEIRFVRARYLGVLSSIVFMRVFGADDFPPLGRQSASIRDCCRPRHREDSFILDREMKLKALALVPGIGCPTFGGSRQTEILLCTAFLRLFRDFVINQPITFHHVQSLGVRRAIHINHGKRSVGLNPNGVYHQSIALVVAHGIPIPGWRHLCWMSLVHA